MCIRTSCQWAAHGRLSTDYSACTVQVVIRPPDDDNCVAYLCHLHVSWLRGLHHLAGRCIQVWMTGSQPAGCGEGTNWHSARRTVGQVQLVFSIALGDTIASSQSPSRRGRDSLCTACSGNPTDFRPILTLWRPPSHPTGLRRFNSRPQMTKLSSSSPRAPLELPSSSPPWPQVDMIGLHTQSRSTRPLVGRKRMTTDGMQQGIRQSRRRTWARETER